MYYWVLFFYRNPRVEFVIFRRFFLCKIDPSRHVPKTGEEIVISCGLTGSPFLFGQNNKVHLSERKATSLVFRSLGFFPAKRKVKPALVQSY